MTTYGETARPEDPDAKPITSLFVSCSFPMRPDAIAASDTCQHPADSGVKDDKGNLWWRCPDHRSMVKPGVQGEAHFAVTLREG